VLSIYNFDGLRDGRWKERQNSSKEEEKERTKV